MLRLLSLLFLLTTPALAQPVREGELIDRLPGAYAPGEATGFDLYTRIIAVDLPAFGAPAFYVEMRRAGFDGPVSRQRIYAVTDAGEAGPVMSAWDFPDGTPYHGAADAPDKLAGLIPDRLRGFHAGCLIRWRREADRLIGAVSRETCRLTNPESGTTSAVDMVMRFGPDSFSLQEQGFDAATGAVLFGREAPFIFPRME